MSSVAMDKMFHMEPSVQLDPPRALVACGYGRGEACDVDSAHVAQAKARIEKAYGAEMTSGAYKGVATYADFRQLIARKDIDAVCISTPDHWHIIASITAARAGKDVFTEKPLTLTIEEGRTICDVIKKTNRVFQTGSEQRARPQFHQMCQYSRPQREPWTLANALKS